MTLLLLAAALQQAPPLEEIAAVELPGAGARTLIPSRAGRFLVASGEAGLHVLEAGSMRPVKRLALLPAAVGFDEKDGAMTVVDKSLRRLDTKEWTESFAAELPGAGAMEPGHALVAPDGIVYYRNQDGWISSASVLERKLDAGPFRRDPRDEGRSINRFWDADAAGVLFLSDGGQRPGIFFRGRFFGLADLSPTLLVRAAVDGPIVVGKDGADIYANRTYKCIWRNHEEGNTAAAVDAVSGAVFISGRGGLRGFSMAAPDKGWSYDRQMPAFSALAVDSSARVLYGVTGDKIRSWRIK